MSSPNSSNPAKIIDNSFKTISTTPKNRRKFPRANISCDAYLYAGRENFSLPVANVSYNGVLLETRNMLPLDFELQLSWSDRNKSIKSNARVVRHTEHGFAVAFTNPGVDFITDTSRMLWEYAIAMGITEKLLCGKELPGAITLFLNESYDYKPVFTVSFGPRNVWIVSERIDWNSRELWITLPEHGLFDCRAKILRIPDNVVMGIGFIEPSQEFRAAYRRIIRTHLALVAQSRCL
jgi:hypothetical protein